MAGKPIFRGISFPYRKGTDGFPQMAEDLQVIKEDLSLLLNTRKRERVMLPDFGLDLERLIFENTGPLLRAKAFREIADAVGNYEPRVSITNVSVTDRQNTVTISVKYQVLGFQDQMDLLFQRDDA